MDKRAEEDMDLALCELNPFVIAVKKLLGVVLSLWRGVCGRSPVVGAGSHGGDKLESHHLLFPERL